jgi:hypothetical protein
MFAARNALMTADSLVKRSYSHTFSGSTKPSEMFDVFYNAGAGATSVASGVLREGNSTASNATYITNTVWGVEMATDTYSSGVVNADLVTTDRAIGPSMSNADGSMAVFAYVRGNSSAAGIQTFKGGVRTGRATLGGLYSTNPGDVIELVSTESGGIYTYTVWKNGSATALAWTDSTGIIDAPVRWPGGAFVHIYLGAQYASPGISGYSAADT